MAAGVIAGFEVTRIATTAATQITTAPAYVVARLVSNTTTAVTLTIYNGTGTAVASQVSILKASPSNSLASVDETGIPVRCPDGCKVVLSSATGVAFVGKR